MILALVITILGVFQAIQGPQFLNPVELDSNIRDLSLMMRRAPISGEVVYRPNSVFVSDGRFAFYLVLMWLISFGAVGYSFLRKRSGRTFSFLALGMVTVALALQGSRGGLMWTCGNALVTTAAFLWGAPRKGRDGWGIISVIRNASLICGICLFVIVLVFPKEIGARLAFYSETLSPDSPSYEMGHRLGEYPIQNFMLSLSSPQWPYGYGIGTASMGRQYVAQWTQVPALGVGVESGFGVLVVEFGIMGLVLWFAWAIAILIAAFRVVRSLKGTPYFPIAFSIFWFAFLLLLPLTYTGMQAYQNFVMSAYLWLLLGILFGLPRLTVPQKKIRELPSENNFLHAHRSTAESVGFGTR